MKIMNILAMLEDFYIESTVDFKGESIEELREFIVIWVEKKINTKDMKENER